MNLELPFTDPDVSALDEFLAGIDAELDALFLDEVEGVLQRVRADPDVEPDPAIA